MRAIPNAAAVSIARLSTLGRGTASTSSIGSGSGAGSVSLSRSVIATPSSALTSALPIRPPTTPARTCQPARTPITLRRWSAR